MDTRKDTQTGKRMGTLTDRQTGWAHPPSPKAFADDKLKVEALMGLNRSTGID